MLCLETDLAVRCLSVVLKQRVITLSGVSLTIERHKAFTALTHSVLQELSDDRELCRVAGENLVDERSLIRRYRILLARLEQSLANGVISHDFDVVSSASELVLWLAMTECSGQGTCVG